MTKQPTMRIEAVCVCVDYADYLEEVLPFLLPHVDDMVVVTTPQPGRVSVAVAQDRYHDLTAVTTAPVEQAPVGGDLRHGEIVAPHHLRHAGRFPNQSTH